MRTGVKVLLGSCSAQYDCDDPSENYVGVFTGSWSVSGEEAMTVDLKDKAGASLRFRLRALAEGYVAVDDVESAREMAAVKEVMESKVQNRVRGIADGNHETWLKVLSGRRV